MAFAKTRFFYACVLAAMVVPASAIFSQTHTNHQNAMHGNHQMAPGQAGTVPLEPGQGAFAAIAEIVAILNADPKTDWSKVNINALREHLVDMSELTLRARAEMVAGPDQVTFSIYGKGRTLQAIQAMVPAHARVLNDTTAWQVTGIKTATGAELTIKTDRAAEITRIKALGFFGIMATGAHHQAHHMLMATGAKNVHAH